MKRALIVEDVPETRNWLQALVTGAFPGCEIEGQATVRGAVAAAQHFRCARKRDLKFHDFARILDAGKEARRETKACRARSFHAQ